MGSSILGPPDGAAAQNVVCTSPTYPAPVIRPAEPKSALGNIPDGVILQASGLNGCTATRNTDSERNGGPGQDAGETIQETYPARRTPFQYKAPVASLSKGGRGGEGESQNAVSGNATGGRGGQAGAGADATLTFGGAIRPTSLPFALRVVSSGGDGGDSGTSQTCGQGKAFSDYGGDAGSAGQAYLDGRFGIGVLLGTSPVSPLIDVAADGGKGGDGGRIGAGIGDGGGGGFGGDGGLADVTHGGGITTTGNFMHGIIAQSVGGGDRYLQSRHR
ncbi:hypothetical protein [Roseovarius sp. M141]|uniref:hypothetical protein n=1 Tax=Roseovarius sp. M141 TaxID=2583806 RepID=UPI0020CDF7B8|nr:hypothetical protein [Roseovarius sp. M141]